MSERTMVNVEGRRLQGFRVRSLAKRGGCSLLSRSFRILDIDFVRGESDLKYGVLGYGAWVSPAAPGKGTWVLFWLQVL